jgi:dGTPase
MYIDINNPLFAPENQIIRLRNENDSPMPYRNEFQRDRDRILYSKAFRRLSGKTQVFLPSMDDHIRTRLTHTVEVSQLSQTVGENLGLNLDLIEAIALGHDLGHAPFGHIGERTLNYIMNNCDNLADFQREMKNEDQGFKHNYQSLRITSKLASIYGFAGLNLTNFTNWGILNHSRICWNSCINYKEECSTENCYLKRNKGKCTKNGELSVGFYENLQKEVLLQNGKSAWSFEGYVVGICDEIAQRHHDIEDGLISGIMNKGEILLFLDELIYEYENIVINRSGQALINYYKKNLKGKRNPGINELISYFSRFITSLYCTTLIENSKTGLDKFKKNYNIKNHQDYVGIYESIDESEIKSIIGYPDDFLKLDKELHTFLRDRILNSHLAQRMDGKGRYIIRNIFKAYLSNPRQMHDPTIKAVYRNYKEEFPYSLKKNFTIGEMRDDIDTPRRRSDLRFQIALLRSICDNIAGMTDHFAINTFKELYG